MNRAQVDVFLNEGWEIIGQLHRWLLNWPSLSYDRRALDELIRGLQILWGSAESLGLSRLARTVLALEQMLERFSSQSLSQTSERMRDMTTGVEGLQDLLLGFEATREEPPYSDFEVVRRMEQHSRESDPVVETAIVPVGRQGSESGALTLVTPQSASQIDPTQVKLLEHLAARLDETCQRLHARIINDEAPYQTTTSHINHLVEQTCELVDRLVEESSGGHLPDIGESFRQIFESRGFAPARLGHEEFAAESSGAGLLDLGSVVDDAECNCPRVLVLDESMFYRHLISTAVRSAGFSPTAIDSVTAALATLESDGGFSAILWGEMRSLELDGALSRYRVNHQAKLIAIISPTAEPEPSRHADAEVSKLHPRHWLTALDRLVSGSGPLVRKSA